jgi:peptide/nickel transport system substrate-binding protein
MRSRIRDRKRKISRFEHFKCEVANPRIDRSKPRPIRPLALALSTLAVLAALWCAPRPGHGQEATGPAADLLRSTPFDRITLSDGKVIDVEPISPRPLPVLDPKKSRRNPTNEPPPEGNISLPGEKSKFKAVDAKDEDERTIKEITIHLLKGEARDFVVKRVNIKQIDYFEDMLLAEADRLVLARDYDRAFECILRVQGRNPSWAGLDDHANRLLFAEGSAALLDGDSDKGLRLLRELHARRPDHPGLADKLAGAYTGRVRKAFELGLYARGRQILHDIDTLAPDHPLVTEARDRFIVRARAQAREAAKKAGSERLDALTEALRIWPALREAQAPYAEAFAAEPTLDVAVSDVPRPLGPWVRAPADDRLARLLYRPILASDDEEAMKGALPGQLAEVVESSDLGRKLSIRLRSGVGWSDGSRHVSALDVVRALIDRTEPSARSYNARWADLLERVEATEEGRVEVRLTRSFLRPGFWLLGPIGPAHAGTDGRVATLDRGRPLVGDGPYRWASSDARHVVLRAEGDPKATAAPQIRRLREIPLGNAPLTVGALLRGEVSLVEHVPPDHVAALSSNREIKVGRYTRPSLHQLALDGRNPILRNRTLRRGLSYAIDRQALLEETLLRHPTDSLSRTADGPFPHGSYADAPDVKPLSYDPLLAKMLIAAAKKEMGDPPLKLTLEYPARPEPQAVVPKLVEAFRLAGIEIVSTERPESELEAELRSGRRYELVYRIARCDDPVLEAGPLLCPGYDAPPGADVLASVASPRILQLLLQLERAPEFPSAKGLVVEIDRESRDELPIIPLWQLEDHYAWRTRLKGPAEVADWLYQGVETWEIELWFARDAW